MKDGSTTIHSIFSQLKVMVAYVIVRVVCASKRSVCVSAIVNSEYSMLALYTPYIHNTHTIKVSTGYHKSACTVL